MKTKYDIFISYRRDGGQDAAKLLVEKLRQDNYNVSFDQENLGNGDFNKQLLKRIEECEDFILICDAKVFDRILENKIGFVSPERRYELSQELGYDLKDRIIAEYQNYLDSHSIDEITTAIISKIERSIELQTWSNGIVNMQGAIKLLVERLGNSSRSYGNLYTAPISKMRYLKSSIKQKKTPCSNAFKEII